MDKHHSFHIPIYKGDDDLGIHWFICKIMWDAINVTDDDEKIAQFVVSLRKRALTWYMNSIDNHTRTKDERNITF